MRRSRVPRVSAGIVGAGLMGQWHAVAIRRAGGSVAAVVDNNLDAAQSLSAGYRGSEIFQDVQQMLNRGIPLQVLHICTPSSSHYAIARQAMEAGLNLVIEKPVTPQAEETELLLRQAARYGLRICPVHQFQFQEGVRRAMLSLGRIGRLIHLEATFCSAGGTGEAQEALDEIAADILPHPLSLFQRFLPESLGEAEWESFRPGHGELRVVGETAGTTLSILISLRSRPAECSLQVRGAGGSLHLDLFHGCGWMESGAVSRSRKIFFPFEQARNRAWTAAANLVRRAIRWEPAYPGLRFLIQSFYAALRNGAEPPIPADHILQIARIRDLLLKKAGTPRGSATLTRGKEGG